MYEANLGECGGITEVEGFYVTNMNAREGGGRRGCFVCSSRMRRTWMLNTPEHSPKASKSCPAASFCLLATPLCSESRRLFRGDSRPRQQPDDKHSQT